MEFTGPDGRSLVATGTFDGTGASYSGQPPSPDAVSTWDQLPDPFFTSGTWNVSASGDQVISPFQLSFQLPPPIRWTNRESLTTISRDSDVTVTWNPDGYSSSDVMNLSLFAPVGRSTVVYCTVPGSNGSAVIPHSLLQRLTPSTAGTLYLGVFRRAGTQQLFQIPFADGTTGPGVVSYLFRESNPVVIY